MTRKIIDCFPFFNEFDLLEIRLEELDPVVDHFVLTEGTRTFQKKTKPLLFFENRARFKKYLHKIEYIPVDDWPNFFTRFRPTKTWHFDNHQKEGVLRGLQNLGPASADQILISDLDEIPFAEKAVEAALLPGVKVFEQFMSCYFLNNVCTQICDPAHEAAAQYHRGGWGRWRGSVMLPYSELRNFREARDLRDQTTGVSVIQDGGWHLSFMGGVQKIQEKLRAWAHLEYNKPEIIDDQFIRETVRSGRSVFDPRMRYRAVDFDRAGLPVFKSFARASERFPDLFFKT